MAVTSKLKMMREFAGWRHTCVTMTVPMRFVLTMFWKSEIGWWRRGAGQATPALFIRAYKVWPLRASRTWKLVRRIQQARLRSNSADWGACIQWGLYSVISLCLDIPACGPFLFLSKSSLNFFWASESLMSCIRIWSHMWRCKPWRGMKSQINSCHAMNLASAYLLSCYFFGTFKHRSCPFKQSLQCWWKAVCLGHFIAFLKSKFPLKALFGERDDNIMATITVSSVCSLLSLRYDFCGKEDFSLQSIIKHNV